MRWDRQRGKTEAESVTAHTACQPGVGIDETAVSYMRYKGLKRTVHAHGTLARISVRSGYLEISLKVAASSDLPFANALLWPTDKSPRSFRRCMYSSSSALYNRVCKLLENEATGILRAASASDDAYSSRPASRYTRRTACSSGRN